MITEATFLHYLNSLLDGDKKQCYSIVDNLIANKTSLRDIFVKLFQRSMYRVGQMWENDRCSVADEHIATKITEGLVDYVASHHTAIKDINKIIVITCIDKEFHELGARMVACYLETLGYKVFFVGSNTPQNEVLKIIKEKQADIVGISNNFYLNFTRLVALLNAIQNEFPDLRTIVGGQALAEGTDDIFKEYKNVKYICSLDSLDEYLALHNHH
ncbi:MAG: cobalamin B12-binding domain protein [Ignavibacteria bacterium]|nr:MAG: cobalamin B12-binding domain protein [Ignavibacteria bacterium]KAF0158914.1 MAG: cobalamin B12-binding domain protein [Ignavibacteria bacterium]